MIDGIKNLFNSFRECGWFWCEPQPCQNSIFPQGCELLGQLQELVGGEDKLLLISGIAGLTLAGGAIALSTRTTSSSNSEEKQRIKTSEETSISSKEKEEPVKRRVDRSRVISNANHDTSNARGSSLQDVAVEEAEVPAPQQSACAVQFRAISGGVSEETRAMIERSRASFQEQQGQQENQPPRKSDAEKLAYAQRMSAAGRKSRGMPVVLPKNK